MNGREQSHRALTPDSSQVAFFGKITASVTHELNNVLSIIEQTAGLLDDLVAGEERGNPIPIDRLTAVSASIQKQTQRGLGIIERLNRFAHSTDRAETPFDLSDILSNLVELSRRPAGLRRIQLDYSPVAPMPVVGNPLALQHAAFECILLALGCCPADTVLDIASASKGNSACVTVSYPGDASPDPERLTDLEHAIGRNGGALDIEKDAAGIRIVASFPLRPSS